MAAYLTVAPFRAWVVRIGQGDERPHEPGARLCRPGAAAVQRILQRLKSFKLTLSARR